MSKSNIRPRKLILGLVLACCVILAAGPALAGCSSLSKAARATSIEGLDDFPVPAGEVTNLIAGVGGGMEWSFVIWTETAEQRDQAIDLLLDDGYVETGRVTNQNGSVVVAVAKDSRNATIALETEEGKPRVNYHLIQGIQPTDSNNPDATGDPATTNDAAGGETSQDATPGLDQTSEPAGSTSAASPNSNTKTIVALVLIISVVGIGGILLAYGVGRIRRGRHGDGTGPTGDNPAAGDDSGDGGAASQSVVAAEQDDPLPVIKPSAPRPDDGPGRQ